MRFLVLVITTFASLTVHGELPEVKMGDRDIAIHMMPWYCGFVSTSPAFLSGTVVETTSEVSRSPRQTWLSESCVIRVDAAFGHMDKLEGIGTATLRAGYENPLSEPVDPKWGTLRHLKKNQRILLLLEEYEDSPSFGFEALIELTPELEALPDILRRTRGDPTNFTTSDLAVVKRASQILHDQLVTEAEIRSGIQQDDLVFQNRLVLGVVAGCLSLLAVIDFLRRRSITP